MSDLTAGIHANQRNQQKICLPAGMVRDGAVLPMQVFSKRFATYLFFDIDITSSAELANGIRMQVECISEPDEAVQVFSASSREHVATIALNEDWAAALLRAGHSLHEAGDHGGFILVPASGEWLAYQERPVDIGVVAMNRDAARSGKDDSWKDCFFDCDDVAEWLCGRTERDASLRDALGEWFLRRLIQGYGGGVAGPQTA